MLDTHRHPDFFRSLRDSEESEECPLKSHGKETRVDDTISDSATTVLDTPSASGSFRKIPDTPAPEEDRVVNDDHGYLASSPLNHHEVKVKSNAPSGEEPLPGRSNDRKD